MQKPEHVTGAEAGDEHLLRIDGVRLGEGFWNNQRRGGADEVDAAVERDPMKAAIATAGEIALKRPFDDSDVAGHDRVRFLFGLKADLEGSGD